MKKYLLGCLLSLVPGIALAETPVQMPPAPFDQPYRGNLTVISVPWDEVAAKCGATDWKSAHPSSLPWLNNGGPIEACTIQVSAYACTIVLPDTSGWFGPSEAHIADLKTHEVGHCEGWVHS